MRLRLRDRGSIGPVGAVPAGGDPNQIRQTKLRSCAILKATISVLAAYLLRVSIIFLPSAKNLDLRERKNLLSDGVVKNLGYANDRKIGETR